MSKANPRQIQGRVSWICLGLPSLPCRRNLPSLEKTPVLGLDWHSNGTNRNTLASKTMAWLNKAKLARKSRRSVYRDMDKNTCFYSLGHANRSLRPQSYAVPTALPWHYLARTHRPWDILLANFKRIQNLRDCCSYDKPDLPTIKPLQNHKAGPTTWSQRPV